MVNENFGQRNRARSSNAKISLAISTPPQQANNRKANQSYHVFSPIKRKKCIENAGNAFIKCAKFLCLRFQGRGGEASRGGPPRSVLQQVAATS